MVNFNNLKYSCIHVVWILYYFDHKFSQSEVLGNKFSQMSVHRPAWDVRTYVEVHSVYQVQLQMLIIGLIYCLDDKIRQMKHETPWGFNENYQKLLKILAHALVKIALFGISVQTPLLGVMIHGFGSVQGGLLGIRWTYGQNGTVQLLREE